MRQRPFPPRPRRRGLAEPSVAPAVQAAVFALGAERALSRPRLRRRMELTGLTWDQMAPVFARVRTVADWAREWERAAARSEAAGDDARAAAEAFTGQLILSPFHPFKAGLLETLRRCQNRDRRERRGFNTERVSLIGGTLIGVLERPRGRAARPPVLLLPPLASVKEELTPLADPLLLAGHPVLRLELPGQGESPPPLRPDTERDLLAALDEVGFGEVFAGGISLGAFYALRLAGHAPERVRAVFGVSPPAFTTPQDWARQPEVIWQYLDRYFAGETRADTYREALRLHLDDLRDQLCCPVLLYHGTRDRINPPDAPERWRAALGHVALTERRLIDGHSCLLHLRGRIGPEVRDWITGLQ